MGSIVQTIAFQGVDVLKINVEVQITGGLVAFPIVGLPDKAVAESRERIRGALQSIGLGIPSRRIIVNLSPAAVQKEGTHYDLPMALGLLEVMGILPKNRLEGYYVMGELGLNGSIQSVPGILPAAITAFQDGKSLICPYEGAQEATWVEGLQVIGVPTLMSLLNFLDGKQMLTPPQGLFQPRPKKEKDWSDIRGQKLTKRALEIAAAGGHNVLMIGSPGTGKSMLAERFSTILPPLSPNEALEISMIYSLSGLLSEGRLLYERPFRAPHHSASLPALVGGGIRAKPGEVTLAHRGVLFLDELPEFARNTLESLRQPLESRQVVVARANNHCTYPASFQLIAAMNPCPCGYLGDTRRWCAKAPQCGQHYIKKLSGPLLDRIDLHMDVPSVSLSDLDNQKDEESSAVVAKRVLAARAYQHKRGGDVKEFTNSDIPAASVEALCCLTAEAKSLLQKAFEKFNLSLRSCHRIIRVSRTIADLEGEGSVGPHHMSEALGLRCRGL